jgi:hypothetical protein
MKHNFFIIAFFLLRLIFAVGFVWTVHTEGPTLASVTLKLKHRHLVHIETQVEASDSAELIH